MRVDLSGVTKRFSRVTALDGVTLQIPAGRKVALIGPNGSGKSTLTRVVMGMLACEGKVLLDGRSPFEERADLAAQMAYVPQVAPQLAAAVGEVVQLVSVVRGLDPDRVRETAARLELDLREIARRPVRALSGGMRQKLLIALALSAGASLLVLDEPTASLDAGARQRFFDLFHGAASSATLLLCSHRLEEVRNLVDHVVVLEGGRVAYDGPVSEFLHGKAYGVVEVYVAGEGAAEPLRALGFTPGAPGAWVKTVAHGEKGALVRAALSAADGALTNILVRDLETVETAPGNREAGRG